MQNQSKLFFKVLVNHYHQKEQDLFLRPLPAEEKQSILSSRVAASDPLPLVNHPQKMLDLMHYSWLQPILNKFPKDQLSLLCGCLSPEQAEGFREPSQERLHFTGPLKKYLQKKIYPLLGVEDHLPIEYLPEGDFNDLLHWKKNDLVNLMDYIGIYDLTAEVRQISNKAQLQAIFTCITPKQFHFLKACLKKKEKLVVPPLGIDLKKPDAKKLIEMTHRRGLIRFAKALSGQHPDVIWYLAHILDSGRGQVLLKHYQKDETPSVTSFLKTQIEDAINFLKSETA